MVVVASLPPAVGIHCCQVVASLPPAVFIICFQFNAPTIQETCILVKKYPRRIEIWVVVVSGIPTADSCAYTGRGTPRMRPSGGGLQAPDQKSESAQGPTRQPPNASQVRVLGRMGRAVRRLAARTPPPPCVPFVVCGCFPFWGRRNSPPHPTPSHHGT